MNVEVKNKILINSSIDDFLKCETIRHQDKVNIKFIMEQLSDVEVSAKYADNPVTFYEFYNDSLDNLRILGTNFSTKVTKVVSILPLIDSDNLLFCSIKPTNKGSYFIKYYIPSKIEKNMDVFLSHEHIHLLKDTNPDEYLLKAVLGDVIPMFFELVMSDMNDEAKEYIISRRIDELKSLINVYENTYEEYKNNVYFRDLYNFRLSEIGQYFNSFYYAVILYNLYKNDYKTILKLVKKVLNHEITTINLLKILGIYNVDNNELVSLEFEEFKKVLK